MDNIIDRHIFVKPSLNVIVLAPNTGRALPEEGCLVANEKYWRRRVADGSVEQIEIPEKQPARNNASPAKSK